MKLAEENAELRAANAELLTTNAELRGQVAQLQEQLAVALARKEPPAFVKANKRKANEPKQPRKKCTATCNQGDRPRHTADVPHGQYGFPRTAAKGARVVHGFKTGDMVKAIVPNLFRQLWMAGNARPNARSSHLDCL